MLAAPVSEHACWQSAISKGRRLPLRLKGHNHMDFPWGLATFCLSRGSGDKTLSSWPLFSFNHQTDLLYRWPHSQKLSCPGSPRSWGEARFKLGRPPSLSLSGVVMKINKSLNFDSTSHCFVCEELLFEQIEDILLRVWCFSVNKRRLLYFKMIIFPFLPLNVSNVCINIDI